MVIMGKRSEPPVIMGKRVGCAWDLWTTSYGIQANLVKGRLRERLRTTSYGTKAILGIVKVWSPGSGLWHEAIMGIKVGPKRLGPLAMARRPFWERGRSRERSRTTSYGTKAILGKR